MIGRDTRGSLPNGEQMHKRQGKHQGQHTRLEK